MLSSGDVETNLGSTFSIKSVQGFYHQNNPKYGVTAGTQLNSNFSLFLQNCKQITRFFNMYSIHVLCAYLFAKKNNLPFPSLILHVL